MSDEEVASSGTQEEASPARLPTRPGDLVAEKYEVERILGAGGMGIVVSAVHLDLQERVAIKFMLPEVAVVPAAANRFLREAQATSRLKSERIARLHDVGRLTDGTPFMVMELLEGETLDRVMDREGPMPIARLVDLVLQACEPLDEAHRMGIVHRDVKPENLFLAERPGEDPLVKVLDFGISKVQASISITVGSGMMGTATYTSPEQLKNPSDVGPAADVWSLGVILFEGLTGALPYAGASFAEICASVLHEEPARARARRPDLPPELDEVLDRCITKDDARRITSMAELAGALAPFATEEGRALATRIVRRSTRRPEESTSTPPPAPEASLPPEASVPLATAASPAPLPAVAIPSPAAVPPAAAPSPVAPQAATTTAPVEAATDARPSFAESLTPLAMGHGLLAVPPPPAVPRRSRRPLVVGSVVAVAAAAAFAVFLRGPSSLLAADTGAATQPAPAAQVAPMVRAIAARIDRPTDSEGEEDALAAEASDAMAAAPSAADEGASPEPRADGTPSPEPRPQRATRPRATSAEGAPAARAPAEERGHGAGGPQAATVSGPAAVDGAAAPTAPAPQAPTPAGAPPAPEDTASARAYPFGVVPVYP